MKRHVLRLSFAAAIACGASAAASEFSIAGSDNRFVVTRDDASAAETVRYRTVGLSAYPGQHFTETSGTLSFAVGQTAVTNTVTMTAPSADAYKFQTVTAAIVHFRERFFKAAIEVERNNEPEVPLEEPIEDPVDE